MLEETDGTESHASKCQRARVSAASHQAYRVLPTLHTVWPGPRLAFYPER